MKLVTAVITLILSGILLCSVLAVPFFLAWNQLPSGLPILSWLNAFAMLFCVWAPSFVVYFAKAIGSSIADGAKVVQGGK